MDYLDFVPAIATRGQIKTFIESDSGIQQQEGKLMTVFAAWWQLHAPGLGELLKTKKVMELRAEFLSSFVDSLQPVGLLDRFKVAGLVLAIFKDGLTAELERYVTAHRQQVIVAVENWWDKYRVTLQDIEAQRDEAAKQLSEFLSGLGYA